MDATLKNEDGDTLYPATKASLITGLSAVATSGDYNDLSTKLEIVNNVTSTSTSLPLSANQGRVLQTEIDNLKAIGRFLSGWNAVTGQPTTQPSSLPYAYNTGDYFIVSTASSSSAYSHAITITGTASSEGIFTGTYSVSFTLSNSVATQYSSISAIADAIGDGVSLVATGTFTTTEEGDKAIERVLKWTDSSSNSVIALCDSENSKYGLTTTEATTLTDTVTGGVNYKPNGSSYTGTASTTLETLTVKANDYYRYDGSTWNLEINTQRTVTWGTIEGTLSSQTDLQTALDAKQNNITSSSKLSADLIADGSTNIIPTATDKTNWNNKVTGNSAITGDTKCKVTYDSKGLVTGGEDLSASDVPSLDASKITSGTFSDSRIASASTWNNKSSVTFVDWS